MDLSAEWNYLEAVASRRLLNNKTVNHVADYGTYIELIGVAGEMAARRFLQISELLHDKFDGGTDILYRDIHIDVKATVWTPKIEHRNLQWPPTKVIKANVILLTAVNIEQMSAILVGFAFRHEISRAPINPTRNFPCHEIPVTKLHEASRLLFVECMDDLYTGAKAQSRREFEHYGASA